MKKKAPKRRTRLKEKKRAARILKFCLFLALVAAIVGGLAFLSRSTFAKINSTVILGNGLVSNEELKALAGEEAAKSFLKIFKKDNIVLFPRKKLEEKITERFKTIQKAHVSFKTPRALEIKVVEREPRFLWCAGREAGSPSTAGIERDCFFMDSTGFVFRKSPAFSGNIFFSYYGLLPRENPIGSTFLSADRLKSLKTFSESVKTLGGNPVGLVARSEDEYELFLATGGKILFNTKIDFLKTFESLEAIAQKEGGAPPKNNFLARIEYIDLRSGFKAFFKFK